VRQKVWFSLEWLAWEGKRGPQHFAIMWSITQEEFLRDITILRWVKLSSWNTWVLKGRAWWDKMVGAEGGNRISREAQCSFEGQAAELHLMQEATWRMTWD
jgi:hypothetical protein